MKSIGKRAFVINLLGVVMARAVLFSMNPVAVAYFAAAYIEKSMRFVVLVSTIVGMALVLPLAELTKYVAILMVVVVVTGLVERRKNRMHPVAMGGLAGIVTIALGISNAMQYVNPEQHIYLALIEGILVFTLSNVFHTGMSYVMTSEKGDPLGNEELISISILLAIIVYVIPTGGTLEFSFVETAAFLLALFMGYKYGAGAGSIAGAACGTVLSLQNNSLNMIGIMCILGICAGVFRKVGKIGSALVFVVTTVSLGYFYQKSLLEVSQVRALVSSVIVFVLVPRSFSFPVDVVKSKKQTTLVMNENIQNIAKGKLIEFAESFQKLSKTFHSIAETKASLSRRDINQIFDELSDKLCKDCINCNHCWKNNFYDTYKATFSILSSAENNGEILRADIPTGFAKQCINLDAFLYETNRSLELAKINLAWYNKMAESREAIAGQLNEVADIIKDFSMDLYEITEIETEKEEEIIGQLKANHIEVSKISMVERRNKKQDIYVTACTKTGRCVTTREVAAIIGSVMNKRLRPSEGTKNIISKELDTMVFVEDTNFKTLTGMAKATKEAEKVSGDNFSFIQLSSGEMIMTLSDGMGTGKQAFEESESVIELLEQFMEAGFREESAIKLINSILVLKSDQQSCSTIDMSIINLFNGMCDFIKIGASSTFIKRDQWVETICSTSLPVGVFNQVDFDGISKKLYDGDYIIMVTDGVLDCIPGMEKEKFIEELLVKTKCKNPQEMANEVLEKAIEQNNNTAMDDMTVIVAGIWKK